MATGDGGDESLLRQLVAGQATNEARFEEMFRRLDKSEKAANEARDTAKELATTLREQNALVRIAEVEAACKASIESIRADFVHANTLLRTEQVAQAARITELEKLRDGATWLGRFTKVGFEAVKLIVAAGGGALLIKLFGGH